VNQFTILGSLFAVLGLDRRDPGIAEKSESMKPYETNRIYGIILSADPAANGEPSPRKPVSDLVVQVGLDLVAGEPINHFAKEAVNNETVSF
jgi:hypothetical protein